MLRWHTVAAAYAVLGSFVSALAFVLRDGSPLIYPQPWIALDEPWRTGSSLVFGGFLGGGGDCLDPIAVRHFPPGLGACTRICAR